MSNQIRINVLDQENDHKRVPGKTKTLDQENVRISQKRSGPQTVSHDQKRLRVPLAGKDQNLVPGLQRSKSSAANVCQTQPLVQNGNQALNQTHGQNHIQNPNMLQRLRPVSTSFKQPSLLKSNSSLGFTHRPSSLSLATQIRNANPHKNTIFPQEDAHRSEELTPRFSTDSVKKSSAAPLPPLNISLADTISENTHRLHASNVQQSVQHPGDPIKRSKSATKNALIESLAEDPDSIEMVAHQDLPVPRHVPLGVTQLLTLDLEFIRTGTRIRTASPAQDVSFESTWDEDNIDDEEENMILEGELAQSGLVGLSTEELNDLLDF